jgi:hypothetical protein
MRINFPIHSIGIRAIALQALSPKTSGLIIESEKHLHIQLTHIPINKAVSIFVHRLHKPTKSPFGVHSLLTPLRFRSAPSALPLSPTQAKDRILWFSVIIAYSIFALHWSCAHPAPPPCTPIPLCLYPSFKLRSTTSLVIKYLAFANHPPLYQTYLLRRLDLPPRTSSMFRKP